MRKLIIFILICLISPYAQAEQKGEIRLICEPGYKVVLDNTIKGKRKRRTPYIVFEDVSYGKHFITYSKGYFIEDTLILELDSTQMTVDINKLVTNKIVEKVKPGEKSKRRKYDIHEYNKIMKLPADTLSAEDYSHTDALINESFPKMIETFIPEYPRVLKNNDITGVVWIKALVGPDGLVKKAMTGKSSGNKALDTSAVLTAYKNRYQPAVINNKRISVWISYKVNFDLSD